MPSYLELSITRDVEECAIGRGDTGVHNPACASMSFNGDVALFTLEEAASRRSVTHLVILVSQYSPLHIFEEVLVGVRLDRVHGRRGIIFVNDCRHLQRLRANVLPFACRRLRRDLAKFYRSLAAAALWEWR